MCAGSTAILECKLLYLSSVSWSVLCVCRKHGKKFIAADAHGFFAIMWLDLIQHTYMSGVFEALTY